MYPRRADDRETSTGSSTRGAFRYTEESFDSAYCSMPSPRKRVLTPCSSSDRRACSSMRRSDLSRDSGVTEVCNQSSVCRASRAAGSYGTKSVPTRSSTSSASYSLMASEVSVKRAVTTASAAALNRIDFSRTYSRRKTSDGCSSITVRVETRVGLKFSARFRFVRSRSFRFHVSAAMTTRSVSFAVAGCESRGAVGKVMTGSE